MWRLAFLSLLLVYPAFARAEAPTALQGRPAPPWGPGSWIGGVLEPKDLRGRVAFVLVLADGDAAARRTLRALKVRYRERDDARFAAVVPSGAGARELATQTGVPVCAGRPRDLEKAYGSRAGSWALVLDRRGIVRYHGAVPSTARAALIVDALRTAGRQANPLVGQPFGSIAGLRFHGGPAHDFGAHPLTLVRWWTVSCPHCRASLPDLAALHRRQEKAGLAFLPVYHFKGGRRWPVEQLRAYLGRLGHPGPFAEDPGWRKLHDVMGRARFNRATSVSFLVDRRGIVRWVHPGPRVHASANSRHAEPDASLRGLEATVDEILATGSRRAR